MVSTITPSKSNVAGSLAGLVSGLAVSYLASAGYLAAAAAAVGIPEAMLATVAGVIVASVVNFGVTHVSELKLADSFLASLPKVYAQPSDFPSGKNGASAASEIGQALKTSDTVAVVDTSKIADFPQGTNGK